MGLEHINPWVNNTDKELEDSLLAYRFKEAKADEALSSAREQIGYIRGVQSSRSVRAHKQPEASCGWGACRVCTAAARRAQQPNPNEDKNDALS